MGDECARSILIAMDHVVVALRPQQWQRCFDNLRRPAVLRRSLQRQP